jgi:hypothetical protein
LDIPEEPGRWQVRLKPRLHNGDVVFLSHAKYDPFTRSVAKGINAQLEASYDPELKHPAFVKRGRGMQGLQNFWSNVFPLATASLSWLLEGWE